MTDQEKRNYNREHYLKNRPEILERVKSKYKPKNQSFLNVIPLFKTKKSEEELKQTSNEPPQKNPGIQKTRLESTTLFLYLLASANIYFLITETAHFYASVDGDGIGAYLKALLLEGAVFAFSTVFKAKNTSIALLYKFMILLIYVYSIWALSGSVIYTAVSQSTQVAFYQKTLNELEIEVSKKIALRDSYNQQNRITLASKIDKALGILNEKTESNRDFLRKSPNTSMIWNTLLSLILFRVLVMLTNLFCLKELGRRYRMKHRTT